MCLIVFGYQSHPRYSFILAANRDEFYQRPTAPADFWRDNPNVLAGRDLTAGGTWLGITKTGRFSAVTNYRDPFAPAGIRSRGELTKNFLVGEDSPDKYLQNIEAAKNDYSGFNLLIGKFAKAKNELFYYSNRGGKAKMLAKGIYGLSNHLLDTDWYKVEIVKTKFEATLRNSDKIQPSDLIEILADTTFAPAERLPETGVGLERERILSPAFIKTESYGTRSSTVLTIEYNGTVNFTEKTFIGEKGELNYQFLVD